MGIRRMKASDYEKVYELWLSCSGMGLNNLDDSRKGIEKFLKRNPETCFVADRAEAVIGVILVGHDGRRGHIYHACVHPEYRREGIAGALVEKAIEALESQEINKVTLVVFEENRAGNEFWEKMGFTEREDLIYRNKTLKPMTRINSGLEEG